jgi:hypothetical protein
MLFNYQKENCPDPTNVDDCISFMTGEYEDALPFYTVSNAAMDVAHLIELFSEDAENVASHYLTKIRSLSMDGPTEHIG